MSAAAQLEVQPYSVVRRPSDAGFIVGLTYFAPLALLPLYLQDLMGYPILTAGFALAPRGFGTLVAMMIVGKLVVAARLGHVQQHQDLACIADADP